jgi:hypothetical protein
MDWSAHYEGKLDRAENPLNEPLAAHTLALTKTLFTETNTAVLKDICSRDKKSFNCGIG